MAEFMVRCSEYSINILSKILRHVNFFGQTVSSLNFSDLTFLTSDLNLESAAGRILAFISL